MNGNKFTYISQITNELIVDSGAPDIGAYLLALEGWRRGLTLRWQRETPHKLSCARGHGEELTGKLFTLSSADRTHHFCGTAGDKLTSEAVQISHNRKKIKELLIKNKISAPEGQYFAADNSEKEIAAYARELGFPVSVKTDVKKPGKSSMLNLKDEEMLLIAVKRLRENFRDSGLILERFISGKVFRLFVIENKVTGAVRKLGSNLSEDKINSIDKNKLTTISGEDKKTFMTVSSKKQLGSDTIDVMGNLSPETEQLAVNAFEAVPGLTYGSVDIVEEEYASYVVELHSDVPLADMLVPETGQASDLPSEIIDFYFPETKERKEEKANFYFELKTALDPLFNKTAASIKIMGAPLDHIYAKKFNVSGEVQDIRYHIWLRKQAYKLNLHGQLFNRSDGSIDVIIAGALEDHVDEYKKAITEKNENAQVKEVKEGIWEDPLKTGFEIQNKERKVKEKLTEMKYEIEQDEKDIKVAARQNLQYNKSLSWRVTGPIRSTLDFIKNSRQLRKPPPKHNNHID